MLAERLLAFSFIQEWPFALKFGGSDLLFTVRHIAHQDRGPCPHLQQMSSLFARGPAWSNPIRHRENGARRIDWRSTSRWRAKGFVCGLLRNVKRLHRRLLLNLFRLRDEFFILRVVSQRRVRFQ